MTDPATATETLPEPTDFGDGEFTTALVNVTNVGNLDCSHCFVFRAGDPNAPRDKMNDETMLHQLRVLRDKHKTSLCYSCARSWARTPMTTAPAIWANRPLFFRDAGFADCGVGAGCQAAPGQRSVLSFSSVRNSLWPAVNAGLASTQRSACKRAACASPRDRWHWARR